MTNRPHDPRTDDLDAIRAGLLGLADVAECRRHVAAGLVDESRRLERNAQISASYAAMYLRHPRLFKWSGMAAFASQHVRKLIRLHVAAEDDRAGERRLARLLSPPELETIRSINNAIHDDIHWAHLVYDGCEEGLDRLRRIVAGTPHEALGDGFAIIEDGRRRLATSPEAATERIWEGNVALLRHEQVAVVQPQLGRLSCAFARVFSLGSSLNYEPAGMIDCMRYCSSFYLHMVLHESRRLVRERSLPRLDLLDHRWIWIERVLVPRFRKLEAGAAARKLATILEAGRGGVALDGDGRSSGTGTRAGRTVADQATGRTG